MTVFRIAKRQYINDLSGEGARLFGGRWNKKGRSLLYTAESRSLATVECLVHMPKAVIPSNMCITEIELPDCIYHLKSSALPENWNTYPAPSILADIIEQVFAEQHCLAIKVPSAIIDEEYNILIDPYHKLFKDVNILNIKEYIFDGRLMK